MRSISSSFESGIISDGSPRTIEIIKRDDGSVYVRIHEKIEDCYLELNEIKAIDAAATRLMDVRRPKGGMPHA